MYFHSKCLHIFINQKGIDYLAYTSGGEPINSTDYMAPLIANLEGAGYVVGQNLAGAPVRNKIMF